MQVFHLNNFNNIVLFDNNMLVACNSSRILKQKMRTVACAVQPLTLYFVHSRWHLKIQPSQK